MQGTMGRKTPQTQCLYNVAPQDHSQTQCNIALVKMDVRQRWHHDAQSHKFERVYSYYRIKPYKGEVVESF